MSSTTSVAYLKAIYTSPTNAPLNLTTELAFPFSFSPSSVSVTDKTSYLNALRSASSSLQERLNAELTARMDEDNARNSASSNGDNSAESRGSNSNKKRKRANQNQKGGVPNVDEDAEEENYGEEVQEEEDE
ncbi:hypothetical protein F4810DRAFT_396446 [Camillea tinctor]|nr:hypothetical protein F4810DRAFT_396446 [Camillea tinctor]